MSRHKVWSFFKSLTNSMTNRVILLVMFIVVIAVLVPSYIVFTTSIGTIDNNILENLQEITSIHNHDMERFVSELSDYSLNVRRNAELLRALMADEPPGYHDAVYIAKLHNLFYGRTDIYEFVLYLPRQERVYEISRSNPNLRIRSESGIEERDWFAHASRGPNFLYMTSGKDEDPQDRNVLTLYRAIINVQNQETIAVVKFNVLFDFMSAITVSDDRMIYVFDENGGIIYNGGGSFPNLTAEQVADWLHEAKREVGDSGTLPMHIGGNSKIASFTTSDILGWTSLIIVPSDLAGYMIEEVRVLYVAIALSTAVISVLLTVGLVKHQTRSFRRLLTQVSQVGGDSLKERIDEAGDAEIGGLARSINAMLDRIYELVEQNFVANLNEKEAQLIALEAQFDSHFLYNSLQAISAKAILSECMEVSSMIDAMTYSLRYLLSIDSMVSTKSELAHLDRYFMLLKFRYEERLEVSIDAQENALQQFIPKLSIQVLAENSVKHGLEKKLGKVSIDISIFIEDEYMIARVSDDGAGMTPERQTAVQKELQQANEKKIQENSIGLRNLVERLNILYNGQATFEIRNREGGGVISEIRFPYDGKE